MYSTPKEFIDKLGGYRQVAARVGISDKTMHSHATAKRFPSRWYLAFCALADEHGLEAPAGELFSFVKLPSGSDVADHSYGGELV